MNNELSNPKLSLSQKQELKSAKYWQDCNDRLTKGYELPVPEQNILDQAYEGLVAGIQKLIINTSWILKYDIKQVLKTIDLNTLLPLIKYPTGIHHHYHVTAGVGDTAHKIELDLKIIPTLTDEFANPMNAMVFIALDYYMLDESYVKAHNINDHYQFNLVDVIGVEDYIAMHEPFARKTRKKLQLEMGNAALGSFMKYIHGQRLKRPVNLSLNFQPDAPKEGE